MGTLVVTFAGNDRPGIVDGLAQVIIQHGGNWEASRMARLAGQFTGILLVRVPDAQREALASALTSTSADLAVTVRPGERVERELNVFHVELTGTDREGIVREASAVVARRNANIEELLTEVTSAPMSGELLFVATARISIPAGDDIDSLVDALEALSPDLMVEIRRSEG